MPLQRVSNCYALCLNPADDACLWLLQYVSGCFVLLHFMPDDDASLWLFQEVSGWYALLHFKLVDNALLSVTM